MIFSLSFLNLSSKCSQAWLKLRTSTNLVCLAIKLKKHITFKSKTDVYLIPGAENANDGDISTWWQSPPLSRSIFPRFRFKSYQYITTCKKYFLIYIIYRGRKYNYVDLEINLLQSFQVFPPDYISKLNQILFYSKRLRLQSTLKV